MSDLKSQISPIGPIVQAAPPLTPHRQAAVLNVRENNPTAVAGRDLVSGVPDELEHLIGHTVVLDVAAPFVYLGTLASVTPAFLVLTDADVHDLRDSESTRELYLLSSMRDGVRRNRKEVTVRWETVLSISRLDDVVDH